MPQKAYPTRPQGDTEVSLNLGSLGMSGQEELRVGEWMRMWLSRALGIERVGGWGRRRGGWGKECKGQCQLSVRAKLPIPSS